MEKKSVKNKAPKTNWGILVILLAIGLIVWFIIALLKSPDSSKNSNKATSTPISAEDRKRIEQEGKEAQARLIEKLKTNAQTIPYKDLYRDIEANKNKQVHYKGKVIQVIDGYIQQYRVYITQDKYDSWDDAVLVTDSGKILDPDQHPKILDDDIIEFWGTVTGETSYEAVSGATISLPEISAQMIELK